MEVLKIMIMIITIAIIAIAALYLAYDLFRISSAKKREENALEKEKKEQKRG